MRKAQNFEMLTILLTVAAISGYGFSKINVKHPGALTSVQQKAADVKRDAFWSASEYAAELSVKNLRNRLTAEPESPLESVLHPTEDPLIELKKHM